jgi:hypothetical protein
MPNTWEYQEALRSMSVTVGEKWANPVMAG